jgi:hypothetical protein
LLVSHGPGEKVAAAVSPRMAKAWLESSYSRMRERRMNATQLSAGASRPRRSSLESGPNHDNIFVEVWSKIREALFSSRAPKSFKNLFDFIHDIRLNRSCLDAAPQYPGTALQKTIRPVSAGGN